MLIFIATGLISLVLMFIADGSWKLLERFSDDN